ncbi:flavin reductase family protein [Actinokineospora iranica]|uniref:NADH-FMN oxidoreductase RutF, flavin reductase (DIM6/NTAB) family n=1 Tax=Actinokineospora iranica TaxID=1271860 RepID=A0A1G6RXW7_9PSEU|nr:flavin reductase family protein [Actinokineospora iranica]SDD09428.1 NADH-FMN oxidoreductase RutF, flavin reductase (DIM6/NTAB) family [Actinokineospora iranica]
MADNRKTANLIADPGTVTPSALREVMGELATGVVVLSVGGEHIHGMTANAFTSLSLDPPLVLCCVAHTAVMHGAISAAGRFGVSVMNAGQEDLARHFADKARPLGPAQFAGLDWQPGARTRAPLLSGAMAWLECDLAGSYECGDHSIFVGAVLSAGRGSGEQALLFHRGRFHRLAHRER